MIPRILIDTASIPGGGELRLFQRGTEFSIMLGANELMNSRLSGSEQALATLTCEALTALPAPRMLIGGLGMGFTLRAALDALGQHAQIEIVELVPAVVAWARGPMAELFGGSLGDTRVTLIEADVGTIIRTSHTRYDAILLDVDNGPDGLSRAGNDALYTIAGLNAAKAALRVGGVLAVWSSGPDAAFTQRLRKTGFSVQEKPVRAHARSGARHVIWIATKVR